MALRPTLFGIIGTSAVLSALTIHGPAYAQSNGREAQIVVDADSNEVLYENNARESRRPASITKVMTLYLLFDALKAGRLSWDDRISFSRNAAAQPPTKLFVGAGNSISVQTAVEALVLRSANDVATAVAENLGGSEANFAQMMTSKARELGMSSTTFRNASGLPNATQRTTAEDLARLAIAIHRDFPDQYHWFAARSMTYNGQTITGHNHLMSRMQGMDGLKTGYTGASGFNLAATTERNGRRIVTVVLGGANRFVRDDLVEALTESAYRELGIGATQFAMNPSSYQVNFRDARDAADGAALIMDLPPRPITTGGVSTIAMARSGRRLGFERGPPAFQVADMTQPSQRWPTNFPAGQTAQREDGEDGATDEGEDDGAPRTSTPTRVPVPFRVAVVSPPTPVPPRNPRVPPIVPSRTPVIFPTAVTTPVRVPVPVPVPMRQMAAAEAQSPAVTPPKQPIIVLPPNPNSTSTNDPRPPAVVFPTFGGGLRGTNDAPAGPQSAASEANAPQSAPSQAAAPPVVLPPVAVPTQIAASTAPTGAAPVVSNQAPVIAPVQMAEATVASNIPATEEAATQTPVPAATPQETQVAAVEASPETLPEAMPTQMAELARQDAASLGGSVSETTNGSVETSPSDLNGSINFADNGGAAGGLVTAPTAAEAHAAAVAAQETENPPQMAARQTADAVALAQRNQAEAAAREQARIDEAIAGENARRVAARNAAASARAVAERQANERRVAERLVAEARAKAQKDKEARELALAEREAAQERAVALQAEERRQAEATRARNVRGNAVVQVGAFKDRADATRAIAQFARYFPSFAQREVSSIQRRDGVWYRARFVGLGAIAAREACSLVSGRGGACQIVGD
jgi:D-alanyl-D-alanine carboxypeptidase